MAKITFYGSGNAFNDNGRFSQAILLQFDTCNIFVDFGPQTLVALKRETFNYESLDMIVITHFHGDHIAGLPFFILDLNFRDHRTRPLTIVGPKGVEEVIRKLYSLLFPGTRFESRDYKLQFIELDPSIVWHSEPLSLSIQSYAMLHRPESLAYKITVGEKVFAITGDTRMSPHLQELRKNADLFVCECSSFEDNIPNHLSYKELFTVFGIDDKIVVNHIGPDVLKSKDHIRYHIVTDGEEMLF